MPETSDSPTPNRDHVRTPVWRRPRHDRHATVDHLGYRGIGGGRRRYPPVHSGPKFIWAAAGAALILVVLRSAAVARCADRRGARNRCLSVPDRHDAAGGTGAAGGPVRLARRQGRASCQRLGDTAVYAGLRVGTSSRSFLSNDATAVVLTPAVAAVVRAAGQAAAALSVHLRLHRQCRELRAADLQSGEPGDLRQPHAAAAAMAAALCAALGAVDRATYVVLRWTQRGICASRSRPTSRCPDLTVRGSWRHAGIAAGRARAADGLGASISSSACRPSWPAPRPRRGAGVRHGPVAPWSKTFPGACCRWSPACSCWSRRWKRPAVTDDWPRCCSDLVQRIGDAAAWASGVGARRRLQPGEQPAGRTAGRSRRRARPGAGTGPRRRADRRRSRAEPVGHRIARDHPVADGAAPRGAACRRLDLPQARRGGHAAGAGTGAGRGLRFPLISQDRGTIRGKIPGKTPGILPTRFRPAFRLNRVAEWTKGSIGPQPQSRYEKA